MDSIKTVLYVLGVSGAFVWGWRQLRGRAPGPVKLLYWIAFLALFHLAAAH